MWSEWGSVPVRSLHTIIQYQKELLAKLGGNADELALLFQEWCSSYIYMLVLRIF